MDIDFEWDETNREANRRKHGVDFADAVEIFYDDLSCSMPDPDHHAERRLLITGKDAFGRVLLVVYAQPDHQTIRIIPPARRRLPSGGTTSKAETLRDEYDSPDSQRGAIVKSNKERITIRLDPDIIEWFRGGVRGDGNYQTLINEALRGHMERQSGADLESRLRRELREELTAANP